jgi:hypothetical protein
VLELTLTQAMPANCFHPGMLMQLLLLLVHSYCCHAVPTSMNKCCPGCGGGGGGLLRSAIDCAQVQRKSVAVSETI